VLEALGFEWSGPVWRQTARTAAYGAALAALRERGLAYPCACTRRERAGDPLGALGERIYPGVCRDGIPAALAARRRVAFRVRVPDETIAFVDRLHGERRERLARDVGDFVVRRSDGLFAYQLAVVVDDAAQRITDVVRGADLLASTGRQIFLQRALGFATPRYLHVPVAIDARGAKLSKQSGARAVAAHAREAVAPLLAAWRFLEQAAPCAPLATPREFWTFAATAWKPRRLPPVAMLPAPDAFR